jgi:imidazolonepropionase-like amidohydrolase
VSRDRASTGVTAIVGAVLIDGNGGQPITESAVLVGDGSILSIGPRAALEVPSDAAVIDAAGRFLIPGFVDTNVHLAPFYRLDELMRWRDRWADVALETAQVLLAAGVTTARDSYGPLMPLLETRKAIARGDAVGPRLYVAGNIVGWGGPHSMTFESWGLSWLDSRPPGVMDGSTSYTIETIQDEITQGVGEELVLLDPDKLATAIDAYLDKGVDFVKFGGTTHVVSPSLILFSPRQQEAIVEAVHRREKPVETHSTSPEGLRISVLAGVDNVQHPEILEAPMSDDLAQLLRSSDVTCSMNVPYWTGRNFVDFLADRDEHQRTRPNLGRPPTGLERRLERYWQSKESWRANAMKMIAAGCRVSTASDTLSHPPRDVMRGNEPYAERFFYYPGEGTLRSIEGLVEVGMSPMDALVSATKHGAMASHALAEYGTIEPGKSADMLLLDADPLEDIHNIRELSMVMARGRIVDHGALPSAPVYSTTTSS